MTTGADSGAETVHRPVRKVPAAAGRPTRRPARLPEPDRAAWMMLVWDLVPQRPVPDSARPTPGANALCAALLLGSVVLYPISGVLLAQVFCVYLFGTIVEAAIGTPLFALACLVCAAASVPFAGLWQAPEPAIQAAALGLIALAWCLVPTGRVRFLGVSPVLRSERVTLKVGWVAAFVMLVQLIPVLAWLPAVLSWRPLLGLGLLVGVLSGVAGGLIGLAVLRLAAPQLQHGFGLGRPSTQALGRTFLSRRRTTSRADDDVRELTLAECHRCGDRQTIDGPPSAGLECPHCGQLGNALTRAERETRREQRERALGILAIAVVPTSAIAAVVAVLIARCAGTPGWAPG